MTDSHYYSVFQNASFVLYKDCMHKEADADIGTLMFLFIPVLFYHLFYYLSLAFFLPRVIFSPRRLYQSAPAPVFAAATASALTSPPQRYLHRHWCTNCLMNMMLVETIGVCIRILRAQKRPSKWLLPGIQRHLKFFHLLPLDETSGCQ